LHNIPKYDNTAEVLLSSKDTYAVLSNISNANTGDVYFTAIENSDKKLTDRNGNDYSYVDFSFFNLHQLKDLKKIIIYYDFGDVILPKNPNALWIQTKNKLIDVQILEQTNSTRSSSRVLLSNAVITKYSFYAIYIDKSDNIIYKNGRQLINYVTDVVFSGTDINSTIFGVKDLKIEELKDYQDLDGSGFIPTPTLDGLDVTLSWFPLSIFKTQGVINDYTNGNIFYDIHGKQYSLTPLNFANIEYYLIYMWIADGNVGPSFKYPLLLDERNSFIPSLRDNGLWKLVGQTQNSSIKITVPENKKIGFFVGFKIR